MAVSLFISLFILAEMGSRSQVVFSRLLASASRSRLSGNFQQRAKSTTPDVMNNSSKVEVLRAELQKDSRTLNDFLPSKAQQPPQLSAAAQAALNSREEELHRSVLGQPKPDYARADGTFSRLRCVHMQSYHTAIVLDHHLVDL